MSLLPCVEVETNQSINASVIWLHGLGADGHDFEAVIPELNLPGSAGLRFVFPHAPSIPVTINGGMVMPAWYDIVEKSIDRKIDQKQILLSATRIGELIDREISRGIDSRRIILAGFSQGGAVAYQLGLSYRLPLAGLLALSTYLATQDTLNTSLDKPGMPILVCHGLYDSVVPESLGRLAVATLGKLGYTPEYKTYPMQHSLCTAEILDVSNWIQRVLEL